MKLYFYAYIVGEVFGINAPILVQKFVESSNTIYINDTTKDERKILKISFLNRSKIQTIYIYLFIYLVFVQCEPDSMCIRFGNENQFFQRKIFTDFGYGPRSSSKSSCQKKYVK